MSWDGLLLFNKPKGLTSHTVVQEAKRRLNASKAGHLGTLDPLATGVFPVCLGKATRLAPFYMKADKCYITAVKFGMFTTTDDAEGEPEGPRRKPRFTQKTLEETVAGFAGDYQQRPPAYSAKKIQGKKSYELARKGVKVELPLQTVKIFDIRVLQYDKDEALIYVHCGSGTYIRAIARDLGTKLQCGAYISELTRTKFGNFPIDQCVDIDSDVKDWQPYFIPVESMLTNYPEVVLDSTLGKKILTGSSIDMETSFAEEWVRIFNEDRNLLALAQVQSLEKIQRLQPKIVFN